ncbi:MAG: hypothetical protein ACTHJU_05630, partial [Sphingopyxis sp.]
RFKAGGADARIFFLGNDLLRNKNDPNLRTSIGGEAGAPKFITSGNYIGGRSFALGAAISF